MLGIDYNETADLWSFACMIFELITGDFLFDPKKGQTYSKNDDHIAQMIELLGPMPKNYALAAKNFNNFFACDSIDTDRFVFRKIDGLKHFPLERLLTDKYRLKPHEAKQLSDFLLPMLRWRPGDRPPA
jgi:serine/threonine-protein kinase SRPK3